MPIWISAAFSKERPYRSGNVFPFVVNTFSPPTRYGARPLPFGSRRQPWFRNAKSTSKADLSPIASILSRSAGSGECTERQGCSAFTADVDKRHWEYLPSLETQSAYPDTANRCNNDVSSSFASELAKVTALPGVALFINILVIKSTILRS